MAGLRGSNHSNMPSRRSPLYRSKYKDHVREAGSGVGTITKPSLTLFVTSIPKEQTSSTVEAVFASDEGFLQCRPVGASGRRMVFVDYSSVAAATKAMQRHQGHCWAEGSGSLKIDFDKDERSKRGRAVDKQGKWKPFGRGRAKKPGRETEKELFARLKREAAGKGTQSSLEELADASLKANLQKKQKITVGQHAVKAIVRVREISSEAHVAAHDESCGASDTNGHQDGCANGGDMPADVESRGICGYSSDSSSEEQEGGGQQEDEEEEEEDEEEVVTYRLVGAK